MAYEQKDGDVAIFFNDKKQTDKSPDVTIKIRFGDKDVSIPLWKKQFGYSGTISNLLALLDRTETPF